MKEPTEQKKSSSFNGDLLAMLSILIMVIARFWQTVFLGLPISRADMLTVWDSMFQTTKTSQVVGIEEGTILFMTPYRFLVANLWRAGEIPLWNQYSGLGCPLMGDPQSIVFSPFLWPLIIQPTMYVYNLILVIQLFITAIGMYLLVRQLKLSISTGLFAALTISLCPYIQWYLELLGNGYCLVPLLFFAFAKLGQELTLRAAAIAGAAASLMVLSAHPEISICSVGSACIFLFIQVVTTSPGAVRHKLLLKAGGLLALAGALAICITAPLLTQAAEFIFNSDSYKFGSGNPAIIPWQAMLTNLVIPVNGAISPYLGIAAFMLAPLGLFGKYRTKTLTIMILYAVILGMNAKIPPFSYLYLCKPFNLVVATYFTSISIVLFTLIAAMGFEKFADSKANFSRFEWLCLIATACIGISLRPILALSGISYEQFNFDLAFPTPGPSRNHWYLQIIVIVLIGLIAILKTRVAKRYHVLMLSGITSLGVLSQITISFQCLPTREFFDFPRVTPLQALKNDDGRMLAVGPHLYKPNTNLMQRIKDIRFLNPLFPKRFLPFAENTGATISSFKVEYDLPLSPLLDLAGVRNILSLQPAYCNSSIESLPLLESATKTPIVFAEDSGLTLEKLESIYLPSDRSVLGKVTYSFSKNSSNLAYQLVLNSSENGAALYWSDLKPINRQKERTGELICDPFSIPIPAKLPSGTRVVCGLRIQDRNTGKYVLPPGSLPETGELIKLTEFVHGHTPNRASYDTDIGTGYHLKEENDKGVRWYQSDEAKPNAYLVHKIIAVDSADEAINKISSTNFNSNEFVVLENSEPGVKTWLQTGKNVGNRSSSSKDRVTYVRQSNSSIALSTDSEEPSVLVITETFYPGWKATIDGKSAPILHGNYLFKSLILEAGHHEIRISYFPDSLKIGVLLCIIGLVGTAIALFRKPGTN